MDNIKFEKANQGHEKILLDIYDDANMVFDERLRAPGTIDIFESILQKNEVYILYDDGVPVAFCAFKVGESVHIEAMYVKLSLQKKGYGSLLLKKIYNLTSTCNIYTLDVLKSASWAIRFYEKNGFTIYNQSNDVPKQMKKVLNQLKSHNWSYVMFKVEG